MAASARNILVVGPCLGRRYGDVTGALCLPATDPPGRDHRRAGTRLERAAAGAYARGAQRHYPAGWATASWACGRRWRLGRALRWRRYDQALLLPNSLKSALVPLICRYPAPHRLARRVALRPGQRPAPARRAGPAADGAALSSPWPSMPASVLPVPLPAPRLSVDADQARPAASSWGWRPIAPCWRCAPGRNLAAPSAGRLPVTGSWPGAISRGVGRWPCSVPPTTGR